MKTNKNAKKQVKRAASLKKPVKRVIAKNATAPTKFRFAKQPKFEVGYKYAYDTADGRGAAYFCRKSKQTKNTVTLYVPREPGLGKGMKRIQVAKSAIILDPWAAVQNVPRTAPPKCVLFKPQSRCERKYWNSTGQSKVKGIRVKAKVKSSSL